MTVKGQQTALGDRDAPIPTTPDIIPAGCYWWTDPNGDLCLMPGCWARVHEPDAECICDKLGQRLRALEEKLRHQELRERSAATWWAALREAVGAHPDAAAILADTRRRAGR
ncbi:hypothetical protein [Streptomyces sp. NPDC001404]|uniref:hypothetical protein n=1 Tax=Streptomyces sp. NPDC001404 TaxID=3364571 RepID=UPI00368805CE